MSVDRLVRRATAACALLAPGLMMSSPAWAGTSRWSEPQISTADQGVSLGGLTLDGRQILRSASLPAFTFDGAPYAFTDDARVGAPVITEAEGILSVAVPYEVPVRGGVVSATVRYTLADRAWETPGAGQLSAWVEFSGPQGDYAFQWRLDLGPGAQDAVQVSDGGDPWRMAREGVVELGEDATVDVVDVQGFHQQSRVRMQAGAEADARLYVAAFTPGETDGAQAVADHARPLEPTDHVVWFETRLSDVGGGLTGPDLEALLDERGGPQVGDGAEEDADAQRRPQGSLDP